MKFRLRQLFFERKIEDTGEIVSPDLEKYIDYRRKCWSDYHKKINIIRHKINYTNVEYKDLNEWETEKAN